jgi:hypothetical protein
MIKLSPLYERGVYNMNNIKNWPIENCEYLSPFLKGEFKGVIQMG